MNYPLTYYFHHTDSGFLKIAGDDRLDFVQRQTTNDVEKLEPGRVISTVLTNPSARIIDVLQLFIHSGDMLGAITLPGRGEATTLFLKKRVFFMDQVTITDASAEITVIDLEGEQVHAVLDKLGLEMPAEGIIISGNVKGIPVQAIGQRGPGKDSVRFILAAADIEAIQKALEEAGAGPLSRETYEALRVAAGLPGARGELVESFTPLEARMKHLVSDTKGCYTGQEVIARQITYDKVTRSLAGIRLDSPVEPGSKVLVDGQNAGTITSYALSPDKRHIALAILKRPHDEPGTPVAVENDGEAVTGEVSTLPFSSD